MSRLKTRTPYYMNLLSDKVHSKLNKVSKETNVAKWLVAEKILEDFFGIDSNEGLDIAKWLGAPRKKVGKAWREKD